MCSSCDKYATCTNILLGEIKVLHSMHNVQYTETMEARTKRTLAKESQMDTKKFLDINEVAAMAECHPDTVRRALRAHKLLASTVESRASNRYMFPIEAVEIWISRPSNLKSLNH